MEEEKGKGEREKGKSGRRFGEPACGFRSRRTEPFAHLPFSRSDVETRARFSFFLFPFPFSRSHSSITPTPPKVHATPASLRRDSRSLSQIQANSRMKIDAVSLRIEAIEALVYL